MSRWGKNRNSASYALPLDALVKEKENSNRPVAATVGKWGITSFTSIRARPAYGFASFSPNQEALQYSQISPKALVDGTQLPSSVQSSSNNNAVAKPKKFFKSRNAVDAETIVAALSDPHAAISSQSTLTSFYGSSMAHQMSQQQKLPINNDPRGKEKRKRKSTKASDLVKKTKTEKQPKVEKPPKPTKPPKQPKAEKPPKAEKVPKPEKVPKVSKKKTKAIEKVNEAPKPTRILSRARKTVNYSEDKSRSPSPKRNISYGEPSVVSATNDLITSPIRPQEFSNDFNSSTERKTQRLSHDEYLGSGAGESPSKITAYEHPPIVLRISKGTSRLISTDSEGVNSPPYLSPVQQTQQSNTSYSAAAASLVAVLSDDPLPSTTSNVDSNIISPTNQPNPVECQSNVTTPKARKERTKPKAEPIKLKIKTNARFQKNNTQLDQQIEEIETPKIGRNTRRTPQQLSTETLVDSNIPVPGTANYELYRTLTDNSLSNTQFDSVNCQLNAPTTEPVKLSQRKASAASETHDILSTLAGESGPKSKFDDSLNTEKSVESSIVPKKRKTKAKTKFESNNAETVAEEPVQRKQKYRKKINEQPLIDVTTGTQCQSKAEELPVQNIETTANFEKVPKKRITAAAKKQYKDQDNYLPQESSTVQIDPVANEEINVEPVVAEKRGRKPKAKANQGTANSNQPEEITQRSTRATRHNNGNMMQEKEQSVEIPPATRSYGRKRKLPPEEKPNALPLPSTEESNLLSSTSEKPDNPSDLNLTLPFVEPELVKSPIESKVARTRGKRQNQTNGSEQQNVFNNNEKTSLAFEEKTVEKNESDSEKPSVKLVISKKKGSIFKSRAIDSDTGESKKQKRHVYKHKWDDDDLSEEKGSTNETKANPLAEDAFESDFNMDESAPTSLSTGPNASALSRFSRATRSNVPDDDLRIRNVKKAHQMQEIGEFQEMDDDVEYILELLKSQNPIATRSLAAIQLASKCMTPAFRMHVRAHGTATRFFGALHDATQNQSLGLCTATIMFVLIQDNLNMDLDKHSLELMLNLLDSDISRKNNYKETGLTDEQSQRNEQKVIEICSDIKKLGKAEHLNLDKISIGTLAMETLLTLTSKRAGEWFKDELRQLGGLEHIINTICDCCKQISDYVTEWTETLLEKLRKIERCLRVLENVSDRNEDNQKYILTYKDGLCVETLVKFYKLCDSEIALYPTNESTPAGAPGVVLREALVPTLKVLINLTHTFNNKPLGSVIFGERPIIFDTSLHLLLQAPQYIPEKNIFELSLLVLLLLINLTVHSVENRNIIMEASAPSDFGNQYVKKPAIKALIEYFYKYEELARFVEQNTDDILNKPEKCDKSKYKSQEEIEETVSTLLQKAGNHMEHTMLASYVCLLVGHLVMECKQHEKRIRTLLRNQSFVEMVQVLEKYYNFMNLTASSEAIQVAHMKETKRIIQFLKDSDLHSTNDDQTIADPNIKNPDHCSYSAATTTSSAIASSRFASSSSTTGESCSSNSNSVFNKIYYSGR